MIQFLWLSNHSELILKYTIVNNQLMLIKLKNMSWSTVCHKIQSIFYGYYSQKQCDKEDLNLFRLKCTKE